MQPTTHSHVNRVLDDLLAQLRAILNGKLIGLYLYGSLVTGDFDNDISDIDLLAAIESDLDEIEFSALQKLHNELVLAHPEWKDRIEIAYLSLHGLKTFKTEKSKLGIISPGEPFHLIEAGKDWLVNWYIVCEKGVTLFGSLPRSIIAPISREEYIAVVKDHLRGWREWVDHEHKRPFQAYAILTMCRALYTCTTGEYTSKLQAATWAEHQLPEWSNLIKEAVLWRQAWRETNVDPEVTISETKRFVYFVIDHILS